MNSRLKKVLGIMLVILLMISVTPIHSIAQNTTTTQFKDLKEDHWAYKEIMTMVQKGILKGYSDSTFRMNNQVSRAEFAKMMVLALGYSLKSPQNESFKDVSKSSWEYKYVETAKYYLTGWRTESGDYFKPEIPAVREDMAVALVKAMGYADDNVDESVLDVFLDKEDISTNLKKYVEIAVKNNIMQGSPAGNGKKFNPQNALSRAESAVLLYKIISNNTEEKITYDQEDVNADDSFTSETTNSKVPFVEGSSKEDGITLEWNPVTSKNFKYYKVVISGNNSSPKYPEDGYLTYITDANTTRIEINNKKAYHNGDFGKYLVSGKEYYFSITAVYNDVKIQGNAIKLKYRGKAEETTTASYVTPKVTAKAENGKIILQWNTINHEKLNGYKVVISKNNSNPKYSEDGYLHWITDKSRNSVIIDNSTAYKNGDFGKYLTSGEKYYFSVTAVYSDKKVAGNAIRMTYPVK